MARAHVRRDEVVHRRAERPHGVAGPAVGTARVNLRVHRAVLDPRDRMMARIGEHALPLPSDAVERRLQARASYPERQRPEGSHAILELVGAGLGLSLLPRASVKGHRAAATVVTRPVSARRGGYRIRWSAAFNREPRSPWVDEAIRLIRTTRRSA